MFWATDNHSGKVQKSTFNPVTGQWNWDELETLPEGTPRSVFESLEITEDNLIAEPLCNNDSDGDGVLNLAEAEAGTSSINADSDGDGVLDGLELHLASNPLDGGSTPEDLAANSCSDGVDNDGDGSTDKDDAGCNDSDRDAASDAVDNCPGFNPDQLDWDGDGQGDSCDPDRDEDGVANEIDVCPSSFPGQTVDEGGCSIDSDMDSFCDPNRSGSGCQGSDNCPGVPNLDQKDSDQNGVGDACEPRLNEIFVAQFAHGSPGEGAHFSSTINVLNLSAAANRVSISTYGNDGQPLGLLNDLEAPSAEVDQDIPGKGSTLVTSSNQSPETELGLGWAVIRSPDPVAAEVIYRIYDQSGRLTTSTSIPALPLTNSVAFAAYIGEDANTALALLNPNPGSEESDFDLRLLDQQGVIVAEKTVTLQPGHKVARFLREFFPGMSEFRGTVVARSNTAFGVLALLQQGGQLTAQEARMPR